MSMESNKHIVRLISQLELLHCFCKALQVSRMNCLHNKEKLSELDEKKTSETGTRLVEGGDYSDSSSSSKLYQPEQQALDPQPSMLRRKDELGEIVTVILVFWNSHRRNC